MSVADWAVKNKAILMAGVLISAVTIYLIFDVNYEEVHPNLEISEDQIEINDVTNKINQIEVVSAEEVKPKDQVSFDFDMPIKKQDLGTKKIVHELIEDINEIEVNNPIHIIPVTEFNGPKSNKSSCDDYSKPFNSTVDDDVKESELILNPLNSSIADGLAKRTEERKIKLKEYNYNFSKSKNIKSFENEPAFKRAGITLNDIEKVKASRTSISEDSNGEITLRTNNSFLHDNVD